MMKENPALDRKLHWESAWIGKQATEASWYQRVPRLSMTMIRNGSPGSEASLIDVGGGASVLVDYLLDAGYRRVAVLDISAEALRQAGERLGERAGGVEWIEADITRYRPTRRFDLWHDRAAFHFLLWPEDRKAYVQTLRQTLKPRGQAIIAAFAPDGPRKCSGLDIVRYDADKLGAELGREFVLEEEVREIHLTPAGKEQRFGFYRFRRVAK